MLREAFGNPNIYLFILTAWIIILYICSTIYSDDFDSHDSFVDSGFFYASTILFSFLIIILFFYILTSHISDFGISDIIEYFLSRDILALIVLLLTSIVFIFITYFLSGFISFVVFYPIIKTIGFAYYSIKTIPIVLIKLINNFITEYRNNIHENEYIARRTGNRCHKKLQLDLKIFLNEIHSDYVLNTIIHNMETLKKVPNPSYEKELLDYHSRYKNYVAELRTYEENLKRFNENFDEMSMGNTSPWMIHIPQRPNIIPPTTPKKFVSFPHTSWKNFIKSLNNENIQNILDTLRSKKN